MVSARGWGFAAPDHLMDEKAGYTANQNAVTGHQDQFAAEPLNIMNAHKVSVLMVGDRARIPIGVLHIHDLLRAGVA